MSEAGLYLSDNRKPLNFILVTKMSKLLSYLWQLVLHLKSSVHLQIMQQWIENQDITK